MNKYLITTNLGNVYHFDGKNHQLVLKDDTNSIYTNDQSIRFITKYKDGYILGKSESLLLWCSNGGYFKLPGLIDIKDIIISDNFIVILSCLRDSVYILDRNFNQIISCFNINKDGKIEFFKDRQVQCQEIPSSYFQIFYCPAMSNFHGFDRMTLVDNNLSIHNSLTRKYITIHLNDFSYKWTTHDQIYFGKSDIDVRIPNESITDYISI